MSERVLAFVPPEHRCSVLRSGFDLLAPHYRWLEFLLAGNKLQRCRTAYLPRSAPAQRVLIAGEGHGRFLSACRKHWPEARLTCLDASARMLRTARARLLRQGLSVEGIEFVHADLLTAALPVGSFDLLVTNFFLDCFPPGQLSAVVAKLAQAASPQARWWLADFRVPAGGPARWRALLIHFAMYTFFRLVTRLPARKLTPPDDLLIQHGFKLQHRQLSEWGLLHTDEWERGKPLAQCA